ncbi:MAG: M20/M25/M40 family metallo-hydrolase [Bryobacteraceae bacterium]
MPASPFNRTAWLIVAGSCLLSAAAFLPIQNAAVLPPLPAATESALSGISADSLRGNLSFLASDALKGRFTPSPELDVAAEFIASQFRKAGLEPGGDQGYFQTVRMVKRQFGQPGTVTVQDGAKQLVFPAADVSVSSANDAASVKDAPIVFVSAQDPALLATQSLEGRVVVTPRSAARGLENYGVEDPLHRRRKFARSLKVKRAVALVVVRTTAHTANSLLFEADANEPAAPVLDISGEAAAAWLAELERSSHKSAATNESDSVERISFELPAPHDETVVLKNVVGILRGSDPALQDTAVVVSAHYDHIGTSETAGRMAMTPATAQDRIYNGANDDASGTVSVIEVASALATLRPRPKRSIVFVTFFGEEIGEFGSQWFASHPPFPAADTIAGINLEQVGRTDSLKGPQVGTATVTGYDFSNITSYLKRAGKFTGIKVYKDEQGSDPYFDRSDNAQLALKGIPAHTVSTAFEYPDYHGVGDEWQKIDYQNMAQVDRMVALAVLNLANSVEPPHWNRSPKTEKYIQAQHEAQKTDSLSTH